MVILLKEYGVEKFRAKLKNWGLSSIDKDSDYLLSYLNRGVDKSMLGDYKGAIEDYNEVIKRDSNNTLALLIRGKNKKMIIY